MPLFVKALSFLRNLFLSRRVEVDLDQEVHSHLQMLIAENIRAGLGVTWLSLFLLWGGRAGPGGGLRGAGSNGFPGSAAPCSFFSGGTWWARRQYGQGGSRTDG